MADYSDEFEEEEEKAEKSEADKDSGSESTSLPLPPVKHRATESDSHRSSTFDSDEYSDEDLSSVQEKPKKNEKITTNHGPVDLTPPDKLLKKAERMARRYAEKKKIDKAMKELIRCTALARIVYGDGHWRQAKAHADLAEGYLDLRGYAAQAQQHCACAQAIMLGNVQLSTATTEKERILGVLVQIHYVLGRAFAQLQQFLAAEQALLKAEKVAAKRSELADVTDDDIDEWNVKIYFTLGKLFCREQKHANALNYYEKALDLCEKRYGTDADELIPIYQGLGKVEQSRGEHANHEKAVEHYLQAHSLASANHDEASAEVADTGFALGLAYAAVGDIKAEVSAESYFNNSLATYQSLHGPNNEKTIKVQDELIRLMIRTDRNSEAIDLLKSCLITKEQVYGELSPEVTENYKLLGNIYLSQGDVEKAYSNMKKCYDIECLMYGVNGKKSEETNKVLEVLLSNPALSKKYKSKEDNMKKRGNFSSIVNRTTNTTSTPIK